MPSLTKAEVGGSIASESGEKAGGRREAGGVDAFCRYYHTTLAGEWPMDARNPDGLLSLHSRP